MGLYAKMKGPVDYTVVGSPTITDGIVSDFTYDNYFKTAESISTTGISSFEFYARVKTPSAFANGWCRICNAGSLGNQGTTAGIWSNSSATQSFFHLFGIDIYQQLLTTDTWYRIQYLYSPSSYTATVYDDNGNVLKSYTYSNPKLNLQGVIKFCQRYENYVLGAIDLNNTYIKVNGQLWFGNGFDRVKIRTAPYTRCTVYGTPTIIGGIASNFSNTNYLKINQTYNSTNNKNVEIYVRAKTPTTITSSFNPIFGADNIGYFGISSYSNSVFTIRMGYQSGTVYTFGDMYITGNIQPSTWYRFKITGNNGLWRAEVYDDNNTLLKSADRDWSNTPFNQNYDILLRCVDNTKAYSGSIDLNVSYIKIDGQYWWRGDMQYAETYTLRLGD